MNRSEIAEQSSLVLLEEQWGDSVPPFVKEKCIIVFKSRSRKLDYHQQHLREAKRFTQRVATLLCGLLDLGEAKEQEIIQLENEDKIVSFLQKKLGFFLFSVQLKNPKKKKYLFQANQDLVWQKLYDLEADPKNKKLIQTPGEYVARYKKLLTSVKARMFLAEIVDNNISDKTDREKFFYKQSKIYDTRLNYRVVFTYIFLTSYKLHTELAVETLEDLKKCQTACATNRFNLKFVQTFLGQTISNDKMAEAIISLPELAEYYEKLWVVAQTATLRKFLSYLGQGQDYIKRIRKNAEYIANWIVLYDMTNSKTLLSQTYDYSLPKLSGMFSYMNDKDFFTLINLNPHLSIFLNIYNLSYYLSKEDDERKRKVVEGFINKDLMEKYHEIMQTKYTGQQVLENLHKVQSGNDFSFYVLIHTHMNRPNHSEMSAEQIAKRASNIVTYAISQLPLNEVIKLIYKYIERKVDVDSILPESFRCYLWHRYKNNPHRPIEITCPDIVLPYVEDADINWYVKKRLRIRELAQEINSENLSDKDGSAIDDMANQVNHIESVDVEEEFENIEIKNETE